MKVSNQNDYALFLADGEYSKELENNVLNLNLTVIDNRMDRYQDASRQLNFLSQFLSTFYSFQSTQASTDDSEVANLHDSCKKK